MTSHGNIVTKGSVPTS